VGEGRRSLAQRELRRIGEDRASHTEDTIEGGDAMARFVLIHGAWHGAWCWEGVAQDLRDRGHEAEAIDLPGHGQDTTPHDQVTLDAYAERIVEAIGADGDPVVLAGHSMGGMAITQAAERAPERIARLAYVTAFLPGDGQSLADLASQPEGAPDQVMPNAVIEPPDAMLPDDAARAAFYHRCPQQDADEALAKLNPQPLPPLTTPVSITAERAGTVERHYIACVDDQAIRIPLQRRMIEENPCASVVELDADHSPFFSAHAELVDALDALARG
jgi:pimeloyl-ACP methyl ester carboxylesterase